METTKDSIDWSHVHERFKWMVRDADGGAYLHLSMPTFSGEFSNSWSWDLDIAFAKDFASYKAGTCDWKDSLVERPKASEE